MKNPCVICVLLVVFIALAVQTTQIAPVFVWNRTPSVPLGIFLKLPRSLLVELTIRDIDLYVLLKPNALLQGKALEDLKESRKDQAHSLRNIVLYLEGHKVWVLKAIAEEDREYMRTFKRVPDEIKIISTHPSGIDYTLTGLLSSTLIEGFYIRIL